jgi:ketosteroid isomerase-like protein
LFGWQINRGLDVLPDVFLASQFRKTLERPDVMGRLLDSGGLEAAFRTARLDPPAESHQAIANQNWLKPKVQITAPDEGQDLTGDSAVLTASITVRNGQQLVPPKAFANGVMAAGPQKTEERDVPGGRTFLYRWKARLPSDPRILLQVVAATEDEVTDVASIVVNRDRMPARTPRRLYVFATGINDYQDPQIQRLDFASNNARELTDILKHRSGLIYHCESSALLDNLATKPLWNAVSEEYVEELNSRVSPDDVLLMYLSGHGVRDAMTRDYYYVTADAKFADIKSERYGDCISMADLHIFSELPCRKIVILDTCHSGAINQPLRQWDLKAALRLLQEDVVLTLTASEGDQEAFEDKQKRLGRFTYRLIEALRGVADDVHEGGNNDGIVTFTEVAAYVKRTVADDSTGGDIRQYPTVGPIDLLDFVQIPLTSR